MIAAKISLNLRPQPNLCPFQLAFYTTVKTNLTAMTSYLQNYFNITPNLIVILSSLLVQKGAPTCFINWLIKIKLYMWWQYLFFFWAFLFDIVLFRLSGVYNNGISSNSFDLNVWAVIVIGVIGSVLSVYSSFICPLMADKYLKVSKKRMKIFFEIK
jgi:hypothetical protein